VIALHEEREAGSSGGIPHPSELLLARIGVARIGQTRLTVAEAVDFALDVLGPVAHRADDNLTLWPSP
jgi:hypothetical protein